MLEFMEDVKNGKKRMNVGQLFIHEIVEKIVCHINESKKLKNQSG